MHWTFRAKLTPPRKINGLIARSGLIDGLLENSRDLAVISLDAPAGYGKTSLLVELYEHFRKRGERVAWLTLDQDDRSPVLFIEHLEAAFVESGAVAAAGGGEAAKEPPKYALERLINAIALLDEHVVLVLDDHHSAHCTEIERLIDFLIDRQPPNLLLIFSGRGRVSRRFATLELNAMLRRVTMDELRFDIDEILAYFGHAISREQAAELLDRTQGWPVAVQLVRLWYASNARKIEDLTAVSGRSAELASYLIEAVFLDLPDDVRSFLLETSVLARLHGDLVNAILDRSDGWLMIEAVQASNLFLMAADENGQWFKYHPLFSEFLLERLRRERPGREVELRQRAARWLMERGLFVDGALQAIASGDRRFAARLLEEHDCTRLVMSVGTACLDSFEAMDVAELTGFPSVAVSMIYKYAQEGRLAQATHLHERLAWMSDMAEDSTKASRLKAQYAIYGGIINVYKDVPLGADVVERYGCTLDNVELEIEQLESINLLAMRDIYMDDLPGAVARAEALSFSLQRSNLAYFQQFGYLLCGLVAACAGRLSAARDFYLQCMEVAEAHFQTRSLPVQITRLLLSEVLSEQGDADGAAEMFPLARMRLASDLFGWFEVFHSVLLSALPRMTEREGLEKSLDFLSALDRHARHHSLVRLRKLIPVARTREALRVRDLVQARTHCREIEAVGLAVDADAMEPGLARHHFFATETRFRMDLAEGRVDGWGARLAAFADRSAAMGWRRWHVRFLIAQAICARREGSEAVAGERLREASDIAGALGLVAPFAEWPDELPSLATPAGEGRGDPVLVDIRDHIGTGGGERGAPVACDASRPLLSPREKAVLELLTEGMTSKDIARSLDISLGTVKGYRKDLFQKLDVNSRYEAIRIARSRKLIS
ncbi:LuxR family transcriptional regulator [Rhizorhabdus wittichii DC-6]|nr:LuxR family transcriptional regulator [Rhizorhabdus wittichii DC-6]